MSQHRAAIVSAVTDHMEVCVYVSISLLSLLLLTMTTMCSIAWPDVSGSASAVTDPSRCWSQEERPLKTAAMMQVKTQLVVGHV